MLDSAARNKYQPIYLQMATVALKCFTELLSHRPVFNFSDNIMRVIVPYLSSSEPQLRDILSKASANMFKEDETGQFSLRVR